MANTENLSFFVIINIPIPPLSTSTRVPLFLLFLGSGLNYNLSHVSYISWGSIRREIYSPSATTTEGALRVSRDKSQVRLRNFSFHLQELFLREDFSLKWNKEWWLSQTLNYWNVNCAMQCGSEYLLVQHLNSNDSTRVSHLKSRALHLCHICCLVKS